MLALCRDRFVKSPVSRSMHKTGRKTPQDTLSNPRTSMNMNIVVICGGQVCGPVSPPPPDANLCHATTGVYTCSIINTENGDGDDPGMVKNGCFSDFPRYG